MSQRWLRILAAIVAFAIVVVVGIVIGGTFTADSTNSWALITAIALVVGFVAYAGIEYLQTGRFDSIAAAAWRMSSWSMAFSSPWFCFSLTRMGTLASTFGL